MARPLRLEHAGAVWHVSSHGDPKKPVFRDDRDREEFVKILAGAVEMFRWKLYAYALLKNEYHLVLETPEPNLSNGMRQINGIHTQRYNRRHRKSGALMHGRFKSVLIEKESRLPEMIRWVLLAPVRAGEGGLSDYRWSSYRSTAGLRAAPPWLDVSGTLGLFGRSEKKAQQEFRRFSAEGRQSDFDPRSETVGQVYLGTERFRESVEKTIRGRGRGKTAKRPGIRAIMSAVAEEFATTPQEIRKSRRGPARKAVAFLARREGNLRLADIAQPLGIADLSASQLARSGQDLAASDAGFRKRVERIAERLG